VRITAFLFAFFSVYFPYALKAGIELQPHRAYYKVTMESRSGIQSPISDVRGTMMIELEKEAEGWTMQQRSETWLYYNDDSVEHVRWGYVTYEAEDESLFKFNTYRKINDELVEDIKGIARKTDKHIDVDYQKPHKKTLQLSEGTLFPLQHTRALLKAAEQGDQIFPRVVFDGSSDEGASEINTFIGVKKVTAGNPAGEGGHQFANQPFWPVRFAVYGSEKAEYEPIYTTSQDLLPNGIIKQYIIDYGGIKIRGVLERIELLRGV